MLSSLRDTSPPVGYFRGTDSFCRMTFSHDCLDWFGRGGLMCAHPVSEAVSCFMPEPESRARASPASGRRNTAVAYTDSMMLHWTVRTVLSLAIVAYLAGRFRSGSWLRATSEAIGQTVLGARQSCVCLVSGALKMTGSSLTTVSPAVAHTPHRRTTRACRGADLGECRSESQHPLNAPRGAPICRDGCAWSDIADGWTRRCRVTAGKCVQQRMLPGCGRPSHALPSHPSRLLERSQSFHSHLSARVLMDPSVRGRL